MPEHTTLAAVASLETMKIRRFAQSLEGSVVVPADAAYESARPVWNWAVDRHPGLYVNQLGDEGEERIRSAYGANYEGLVSLKNN